MMFPAPIVQSRVSSGSGLPIERLVEAGQRRLPPKPPRDRVWRRSSFIADHRQLILEFEESE